MNQELLKKWGPKIDPANPPEMIEQAEFVVWFRRKFPDVLMFAVPNGGDRAPAIARQMKLEGVVPGVPDLFVLEWSLAIEFKRQFYGQISPAQKEVIQKIRNIDGWTVIVARGMDDAILQLAEFLQKKARQSCAC